MGDEKAAVSLTQSRYFRTYSVPGPETALAEHDPTLSLRSSQQQQARAPGYGQPRPDYGTVSPLLSPGERAARRATDVGATTPHNVVQTFEEPVSPELAALQMSRRGPDGITSNMSVRSPRRASSAMTSQQDEYYGRLQVTNLGPDGVTTGQSITPCDIAPLFQHGAKNRDLDVFCTQHLQAGAG